VEDPVTGSAAGACTAWLARAGLLRTGDRIVIEQGIEAGRPGRAFGELVDDAGALRPRIGGSAVTVFETTIAV
jgi:predicted PhzF superfamily epimerase YddE/YHI9